MAHYKIGKSRLATRTGATAPEWYSVCSSIGECVNTWAGREDLAVYGGEDSAEGQAVAAYYADISEIEVNVRKAFGEITKPEQVGSFMDKDTHYEFPTPTGIIYHEALHARYTKWDLVALVEKVTTQAVAQMFMALEESRIEGLGVKLIPSNKAFLRSSGLNMALEDLTEEYLNTMSDTWQVANLALLSLARYDCGVLELSDVRDIYLKTVEVLGQDLYDSLREIWIEFQSLSAPTDLDRAVELAEKFVELLREADPEGEPQGEPQFGVGEVGEDESGESEKGKGKSSSGTILAILEDSASETQLDSMDELSDQQTKEEWDKEAKARQSEAKTKNQKQNTAKQIFDKSHDESGSGSGSRVKERRAPTSAERASAVQLSKMLDKAKYRERSVHVRKSVIPQGRLVTRNAIQNKAMESMGLRGDLPAWKSKSRKHTDDPTLRLGIMVDISGSMGGAMEAMATTAWILSEAGHRIQAKTSMVYFGSGVFPTLRLGQRLPEVAVYTAPDGTEKFGEAWEAIDGQLGLTYGDGVRMLVIVSDGQYTHKETERLMQTLGECKQNGVAVLFVTPEMCYGDLARQAIQKSAWGVHLNLSVERIAEAIGKSATEALTRAGGQM
jgi:hypothetical protein